MTNKPFQELIDRRSRLGTKEQTRAAAAAYLQDVGSLRAFLDEAKIYLVNLPEQPLDEMARERTFWHAINGIYDGIDKSWKDNAQKKRTDPTKGMDINQQRRGIDMILANIEPLTNLDAASVTTTERANLLKFRHPFLELMAYQVARHPATAALELTGEAEACWSKAFLSLGRVEPFIISPLLLQRFKSEGLPLFMKRTMEEYIGQLLAEREARAHRPAPKLRSDNGNDNGNKGGPVVH